MSKVRTWRATRDQTMGAKPNQKLFITYLILISSSLLVLVLTFKPLTLLSQINSPAKITGLPSPPVTKNPKWLRLVGDFLPEKKRIRVGLLNVAENELESYEALGPSISETVHVPLVPLPENLTWSNLFPEWVDEDHRWEVPKCPEIPLPESADVDVVVAKIPCQGWSAKRGLRDVFRLQVNLAAANLAVESGRREIDRTVYVVFVGFCGPMHEIFRCDERVRRVGDYWVYKPNLERLKQMLLMPVGSCDIASPFAQSGKEATTTAPPVTSTFGRGREAYVTVLHSSEAYVCGAIALAQSIRQSGSTRDLVLLHDDSLTNRSLSGLRAAGWELRRVERIRSPLARKGSYNEWNYSKLRVWQVTDYDKLVFIDADIVVLKNLDHLFFYPQLSAAGNDKDLFNSGVMVLEPSKCMFEDLKRKSLKIESYNGGDQGFLNENFVWWHRLSKRVNTMKFFGRSNPRRELSDGVYGVHYLGLKPWACYRDYDCNWDMKPRRVFASDSVHGKWWGVYDRMSEELKGFCGLSPKTEGRIEKWRKISRGEGFDEGRHWEIRVKDPRKKIFH
ncbi:PREDICTED: putative UDP-glucuronate:xylan alpha-glucuronosyltransferase 5 [Tarenaya hassleriana]|uniref:putative UDP-glucuronate:xylan alpha-glucuronosyltransferase 5 n=1 Tax=Tarenaya hassleriana TaxID=28532 RepID=UPI00053C91FA|nr:PREDICTED: putative UDP-glucuronate:xylan alpha-glucuronosyltransferase 5 [Tarenaya hassleriana]